MIIIPVLHNVADRWNSEYYYTANHQYTVTRFRSVCLYQTHKLTHFLKMRPNLAYTSYVLSQSDRCSWRPFLALVDSRFFSNVQNVTPHK